MNALVGACSSSEPSAPGSDAGADAVEARATIRDSGVEEVGPVCEPQAVDRPSRYVPPNPWHQPACSPAQVKGFFSSCLRIETSVCEAFAKQNPTCFACAQTHETAPTWGAFVLFEGGYFNANYSGCYANALGDLSANGCGAASARLSDCATRACRSCLPAANQEAYERFHACSNRKEIAKICATEIASFNVKCADHLEPAVPGDPLYPCVGSPTATDEEFYESYLTLFCTPEVDAGVDAGDADAD